MKTTSRLLKSAFPVLTVLLLFMCKDANLVSPDQKKPLVDRIAESEEFKTTMYETKRFLRPSILQMLYATSHDEVDRIIEGKRTILAKGESVTEEDALSFYYYHDVNILRRNLTYLSNAFEAFHTAFPELRKLSETDLKLVLNLSINAYEKNFWEESHKGDNKSGRVESTCMNALTSCQSSAVTKQYIAIGLCSVGGILGIAIGIGTANPLIVAAGAGFAGVCIEAAHSAGASDLAVCSSNFNACIAANGTGEITHPYVMIPENDDRIVVHNLNYYFNTAFWPTIPFVIPPYYQNPDPDPNGCFIDVNGNQVCY